MRYFPWGGRENDTDFAQHCNCSSTGLGYTSAVGLFPTGKAGCGALDMAGNVWEWCGNEYSKGTRVLRGGSWLYDRPRYLSSSSRYVIGPGRRDGGVGIRVVCEWASVRKVFERCRRGAAWATGLRRECQEESPNPGPRAPRGGKDAAAGRGR